MHTTHYEGSKVRFHYDGDYDGDVIIQDEETGNEVKCDMNDLKRFVGDCIKSKLIEYIENFDLR